MRVNLPRLTPRRIFLFLAVPLSGFQFYDPGATSFEPPVCLLAALLLLPDLARSARVVVNWRPMLFVVLLAAAYLVSLAWSADGQLGLRTIVYVVIFPAIFCAALAEARRDPRFTRDLLRVTLATGLIQVAIIFLFRLHPFLKISFFQSYLAGLFVNPDSLAVLFTAGGADNVLDPTKSGGLFINANVAGAYAGLLAATSFGFAWAYRRWEWFVAAAACLAGAFATGSKAAIILSFCLGLAMLLATVCKARRRVSTFGMISLLLAPLAAVAALAFNLIRVGSSGASFGDQAAATLAIRATIWTYAGEAFPRDPLLGQGFGGWQLGFTPYASSVGIPLNFPPHNVLIYLWSQGGMAAVAVALGFTVSLLAFAARQLFSRDRERFGLAFGLAFGFLWLALQALGENYSLLGDEHMEPVLALLCAFTYARCMAPAPAVAPAVAVARAVPAPPARAA